MKKVNVNPTCPVHGAFGLPLVTPLVNYNATEDQIYRCLLSGAKVEEILPNGSKVELSFTNYNKDNGGKLTIKLPVVNNKPQQNTETPTMKIDPVGQTNKVVEEEKPLEEEPIEEELPVEEDPEEVVEEDIQEDSEEVVEEPIEEPTVNVGQPQQRQGGRPHNTKNKK